MRSSMDKKKIIKWSVILAVIVGVTAITTTVLAKTGQHRVIQNPLSGEKVRAYVSSSLSMVFTRVRFIQMQDYRTYDNSLQVIAYPSLGRKPECNDRPVIVIDHRKNEHPVMANQSVGFCHFRASFKITGMPFTVLLPVEGGKYQKISMNPKKLDLRHILVSYEPES